jgi:hypothetical protein
MYVNIHFIRHKEQSHPFLDPPANAGREEMAVRYEKLVEHVVLYNSSTGSALVPYSNSTASIRHLQ